MLYGHLVDATTIQLVANGLDWTKHRCRKAALKCHLRLEMKSFLPSFVLIDTAHQYEATRAHELCAGLQDGEIAIFDKGYVDLEHLHALHGRGDCWVTRAKENMAYTVVQERHRGPDSARLRDRTQASQRQNGLSGPVAAGATPSGSGSERTEDGVYHP